MYLYSFSASRFESSVITASSLPRGTKAGDLLIDQGKYYLCLGEEIARPELYGHSIVHLSDPSPICSLMQSESLALLHRLVNEYYSSYKAALPLWLGNDIQQIVDKQKKIGQKKDRSSGQKLSIFPSLRAATANYPKINDDEIILSGQSTTVQRAKAYWGIKNGIIRHVIATHSQIFRDRQHLTAIDIYDPLSSAYETYADPRYGISNVVDKIADLSTITPNSHGLRARRPGLS